MLADGEWVHVPLKAVSRQNDALVNRNSAWFGEGHDSLFDIGINKELLRTRVDMRWPEAQTVHVVLDNTSKLANVKRSTGFIPAHVTGRVVDGHIANGTELAVAVNGRIRALTRCVLDRGKQRFGALVPEEAFKDGFNLVEVFAIGARGTAGPPVRIGANR
jgi:hypothetical protein